MGIEGFLAINMAADFALLASVSRAMGLFRWRRVLIADAACAALAVLAALRPSLGLFVAVASPAAAAWIITRRSSPRLWALFTLALLGQALLCGGVARLLPVSAALGAPVCLAAGALLTLLVSAGRPPGSRDWQVALSLWVDGHCARFHRHRQPAAGAPFWPACAHRGGSAGAGDTARVGLSHAGLRRSGRRGAHGLLSSGCALDRQRTEAAKRSGRLGGGIAHAAARTVPGPRPAGIRKLLLI